MPCSHTLPSSEVCAGFDTELHASEGNQRGIGHLGSKSLGHPGAYNDESVIEFLSDLNEIEQRPVLLIWNGLPHRSRRVANWLDGQRDWLSAERWPGCASLLNPLNLKSQEHANLCEDSIAAFAECTVLGWKP
jgi:hypothetical protein